MNLEKSQKELSSFLEKEQAQVNLSHPSPFFAVEPDGQ